MRFRLLFLALALILFGGCAQKEVKKAEVFSDLSPFVAQATPISKDGASRSYNRFLSQRYSPWLLTELNATEEEIRWGERFVFKKRVYAYNRLPFEKDTLQKIVKNSNYDSINSIGKYGVTVYPTNLRLFPSSLPIFLNPSLAGEGYPFDYNQNSGVKAFTPIFVSHLSSDGGWAFVQTPFATGWLPLRDFAYIERNEIDSIMKMQNIVVTKENLPIYDSKQNFLFYAKLGTLFPLVGEERGFFHILVPKKIDGRATFEKSLLPMEFAAKMPLEMSSDNVFKIANELLAEPYGWGGVAGGRDCSAMTRDFFAPFGIWLPRNSAKQAKSARTVSLEGLSAEEKKRLIVSKGVPFKTLIHLPGHIMLYVGQIEGEPYVMHNIWGVKTKGNGRYIIGKAVISTLELGKNLPDVDRKKVLIYKIDSITNVAE